MQVALSITNCVTVGILFVQKKVIKYIMKLVKHIQKKLYLLIALYSIV